jgi:hypothetical protein
MNIIIKYNYKIILEWSSQRCDGQSMWHEWRQGMHVGY